MIFLFLIVGEGDNSKAQNKICLLKLPTCPITIFQSFSGPVGIQI